jgi:hypothetical protein
VFEYPPFSLVEDPIVLILCANNIVFFGSNPLFIGLKPPWARRLRIEDSPISTVTIFMGKFFGFQPMPSPNFSDKHTDSWND